MADAAVVDTTLLVFLEYSGSHRIRAIVRQPCFCTVSPKSEGGSHEYGR